jgi:hypothetical protein
MAAGRVMPPPALPADLVRDLEWLQAHAPDRVATLALQVRSVIVLWKREARADRRAPNRRANESGVAVEGPADRSGADEIAVRSSDDARPAPAILEAAIRPGLRTRSSRHAPVCCSWTGNARQQRARAGSGSGSCHSTPRAWPPPRRGGVAYRLNRRARQGLPFLPAA